MSGQFDLRKDSQSTKFEQRHLIFVKLSLRELYRLFQERCAIACACTHTCAKVFRCVINHMRNETFGYMFFLHNFLCLIKTCCSIIRA